MPTRALRLSLLADSLAVCRLPLDSELPMWFLGEAFFAMLRSGNELTVVCEQKNMPQEVQHEAGWRAFKIEGNSAFTETGVLESVLAPLATAGIGIFALSSFETDYVLIKEQNVDAAREALVAAGHKLE